MRMIGYRMGGTNHPTNWHIGRGSIDGKSAGSRQITVPPIEIKDIPRGSLGGPGRISKSATCCSNSAMLMCKLTNAQRPSEQRLTAPCHAQTIAALTVDGPCIRHIVNMHILNQWIGCFTWLRPWQRGDCRVGGWRGLGPMRMSSLRSYGGRPCRSTPVSWGCGTC